LYEAKLSVLVEATARPRSYTSGAASVPLLVLPASTSSLEEAFGFCSLILIFGYFFLKPLITSP